MTIEISPELEGIIQKQLATGRYDSARDVLRHALTLLDGNPEPFKLQELNKKIDQGLESLKVGKGIDGEDFFKKLRGKREQFGNID